MNTLGSNSGADGKQSGISRLNKLPVYLSIALVVVFGGVAIWGLWNRGLYQNAERPPAADGGSSRNYADCLKQGVTDGVIDNMRPADPTPAAPPARQPTPLPVFQDKPGQQSPPARPRAAPESEDQWRARLDREMLETELRLRHQQKMARWQASDIAYDSPIKVDLAGKMQDAAQNPLPGTVGTSPTPEDLYAAAMLGGWGYQIDPNYQDKKTTFFDQNITDGGYLPNRVIA